MGRRTKHFLLVNLFPLLVIYVKRTAHLIRFIVVVPQTLELGLLTRFSEVYASGRCLRGDDGWVEVI
jgi:hypothetical protein